MRSKRSFFNKTLFAKNVTRFWPLWLTYAGALILSIPVLFLLNYVEELRYDTVDWSYLTQWANHDLLSNNVTYIVGMAAVFAVLAAMAVFSYLYSARSAGLMHTLPMTREGLFLTAYLSGLSFLFVPVLLTFVLTFAAEAALGLLNVGILIRWLLMTLGCNFFFFSFAVFCAMFTGHVLALPAFYTILNFLGFVLSELVDVLLTLFLYGCDSTLASTPLVAWFTPVYQLTDNLHFRQVVVDGVVEGELFTGLQYVAAYVLIGVVFTVCALVLYLQRHIETAGDVISVPWVKPIFKYGFALCAALGGGVLLFSLFSGAWSGTFLPVVVLCVVCGVVGCFVAEMLLQKSFKVFRHGWKGCGVFSLALVLGLVVLNADPFGLETWVPKESEIESVFFRPGHDFPPYDDGAWSTFSASNATPELLEQILEIHQTIVEQREELSTTRYHTLYNESYYVSFNYNLKNGTNLRRTYNFYLPMEEATPGSIPEQLLTLVNSTECRMNAYFPAEDLNAKVLDGELQVYNLKTEAFEEVALDTMQAQTVAAAVKEDMLAGRLGIRYLNNDDAEREKNCSYSDLYLSWVFDVQQLNNGTISTVAHSNTYCITPQFTATSLMSALGELGILDESHVLLSLEDGEVEDRIRYSPTAYYDSDPTFSQPIAVEN